MSFRRNLFLVAGALVLIGALAGLIYFYAQGSLFPPPSDCDPVTITNPETEQPITGNALQDAIDNWEQQALNAGKTQEFVDNYRANVNFVFNTVNGTQVLQIKNVGCGTQTVDAQ